MRPADSRNARRKHCLSPPLRCSPQSGGSAQARTRCRYRARLARFGKIAESEPGRRFPATPHATRPLSPSPNWRFFGLQILADRRRLVVRCPHNSDKLFTLESIRHSRFGVIARRLWALKRVIASRVYRTFHFQHCDPERSGAAWGSHQLVGPLRHGAKSQSRLGLGPDRREHP